ncbi:MAG: Rne/Rng family ribonuclease, partial [Patescibacteria group bacterium]
LPFKEISRSCFPESFAADPCKPLTITDVLKEGQEIMVQVAKEERGNKGAALTTFISLAGSYLVLMPNNPRAGGISRRVEGKERDDLRTILSQLNLHEGMGVIIRTAGVDKSAAELQWDLDSLIQHWTAIQQATQESPAPFLIHQESNVIIRAIRDHLKQETSEITTDSQNVYDSVKEYIKQTRPDFIDRVKLYESKTPLFSHYHIEKQIETAYQRAVTLPSGGSIVIDPTEALVSIDVNSAKATAGKNIEETAFNTNLEAADEIAKQLRLRDIGGLIVIDFIDMSYGHNQRDVSNRLREALKFDRARVHIGNITRFGLMEMSRQRIRSTLGEEIQVTCPRCDGQGTIRSTSSLSLSIVRLLEEEATNDKIVQVHAHLPIDLATYLLNEKRAAISRIEERQNVRIIIIPTPQLKTPKYKIRKLRANELPRGERSIPSYKLIELPKNEVPTLGEEHKSYKQPEEPAVRAELPLRPSPAKKSSVLRKLMAKIFGKKEKKVAPPTPHQPPIRPPYNTSSQRSRPPRRPQSRDRYSTTSGPYRSRNK